MADATKEEPLHLIKRLGSYITVKISDLLSVSFSNMDSRSIGAVAGLAVAVFFLWRLLRFPNGSQRDLRAQNVIDEFFQPVKVTCCLVGVILEESSPEELQVVRLHLLYFCQDINVEKDINVVHAAFCWKQATVRSSVLEVLLEITKFCDLYLMERVLDDESEKRVLVPLEDAEVFT